MELFNTLSRKKEQFKPQKDNLVTIYACGPTVYDYAHIGNLRTYIFEDILQRTLKVAGFEVKYVMNITDVDDKTIKKSAANKEELAKITKKFEDGFIADLKKLNIELPNKFTRATQYIEQMTALIESLLDKGVAYKANDGSIYFSIEKFKNYGKLSNLDKEGIKSGARVNQDEYSKENPADFVLWKAWDEIDGDVYWQTSLGRGRPGWHIECSAMAQAELGDAIDIHAGAVDLIFPHHENEIAQSEAASGKQFVRFWIHGEHLLVDSKKMAKSENNFYTLANVEEKGFDPLDFRYLCLGAHYRSKLNFTWEGLRSAKNTRKRLSEILYAMPEHHSHSDIKDSILYNRYLDRFNNCILNDLDTPGALAVLWEMLRDESINLDEKFTLAIKMDEVFGLGVDCFVEETIPEEVINLASERESARQNKDFKLADQIRQQIDELGFEILDSEDRSNVRRKRR